MYPVNLWNTLGELKPSPAGKLTQSPSYLQSITSVDFRFARKSEKPVAENFQFNPSDLAILLVRNSAVSLTIDLEIGTVSVEECSNLRSKFEHKR